VVGQVELADTLLDGIAAVGEEPLRREPAILGRVLEARARRAGFGGDPSAYLELGLAAYTSFRRAGALRNACYQCANVGDASKEIGSYALAEAYLRSAIEMARPLGLHNVIASAHHNLGLVLARTGALDEAYAMERRAVDKYEAQGNLRMEAGSRIYLAEILAKMGDFEAAEGEAQAAIARLAAHPPARGHALAMLAWIRLRDDRAAESLEPAREALRAMESVGSIEEGESLALLVYAEALHAISDMPGARAAIGVARERLLGRAAKMSDADHRRSFLENVPENARTLSLAGAWIEGPQWE
jgi:eukaryotic-like serine/threonine-protein kinase